MTATDSPTTAANDSPRTVTDSLDFAACVGIDWADEVHAVCLFAAGSDAAEHRTLEQTPEAIDAWVAELRQRFAGRRIAVCVEQSRGALIYALLKYDCFVIYPINPKQLARFREALAPSGSKDDPDDAWLLVQFLLKHRDRLRPSKPDDADTRLIGLLVEDRRDAIALRTRLTNALAARLKQYFPQALELLGGNLTTRLAGEFLRRWPTLDALQRARPQTVRQFFVDHNCRDTEAIDQRLELIRRAVPLTHDRAVIDSSVLHVHMLAGQLLELATAVAEYDRQIAQHFAAHPDHELFDSFPGAGEVLAPRLLAAFGSDRQRVRDARQIQQYSGIAPITQRSGKSKVVKRRWACPRFLLQTFHEFANHSRPFCAWAQAFYEMMRARGAGHHAAVRTLAFKWIRVLFVCWKTRTPYNDAQYLASLRRRHSPMLAYLKP